MDTLEIIFRASLQKGGYPRGGPRGIFQSTSAPTTLPLPPSRPRLALSNALPLTAGRAPNLASLLDPPPPVHPPLPYIPSLWISGEGGVPHFQPTRCSPPPIAATRRSHLAYPVIFFSKSHQVPL